MKAFIFYSSIFFYSLYLKNSFDLCCKAFITLRLSYSICFFYSSNWISFDLSMRTLFFSYNSPLSLRSYVSYFLISAFWSKSSLMAGLFFILLARWANFKDERLSWKASGAGEIIVNMVVLQFPPKLSESNLVKTEFL